MSTRSVSLRALVLALVLLPSASALAWPTVDAAAGHRTTLLGNRWSVVLPETVTHARTITPPGTPAPREELDGIVLLDDPSGHFAIHATQLESTRPADLEAGVHRLVAPCAAPTYGTIGDRTDLVAVRCTDVSPDGALRPLVVFAVHPDGWIDRIETIVETPEGDAAARTAGIAYAEAVMATLHSESGSPAVETGTITIGHACESGGVSDALNVTLPDGWIAMRDSTPDAELVRVTAVVPLGEPRPMGAIELAPAGTEPPRMPEGVGTHREGQLLGQDVDWLVMTAADQPTEVRSVATELTVGCSDGATYARALRVSLGGPTTTLDGAQQVVETLALDGTRGHRATLTAVSSEAPAEEPAADADADDHADEAQSRMWSYVIGGVSLAMLALALVMRSRTTRPK